MTQPERYHLVAPLPAVGGWRRMVALDRRAGGTAGPVVLSFPPAALVEDPVRLAALARDAEAGARVLHPNAVPVLGLESVDDQVVVVEPYRAGTTLRALVDASGRLPVELAVRVVCDVAAGLGALHAVDPGDGQPLAHGALGADRVLVAEDGSSLLTGIAAGGGRSPAEDVRALGAVLFEALAGEPPSSPPRPLDTPGVPPSLAAVVDRALGAVPGDPYASAKAFAEAAAGAFSPAAIEAMAVYAEAAAPPPLPPPEPTVAAPPSPPALPMPSATSEPPVSPPPARPPLLPSDTAPEVSAELIGPGRGLTASDEAPTADVPDRTPPPDAAITFKAPARAAPRLPGSRALVLAALAVVGFGLGFALSRAGTSPVPPAGPSPRPPQVPAEPSAPPTPSPSPTPAPAPAQTSAPASAQTPAQAQPPTPPPPVPRKPAVPSLSVTSVPPAEVLVDGKVAGRSPVVVEVKAGEHEVRLRDRAMGVDVRRKVTVRAAATPVRFQLARGTLDVTAPPDTEVWVDGRRVGEGDQKVELWEGWHEVEVRRAGARAHERFELTTEVTRWTYAVTPTP